MEHFNFELSPKGVAFRHAIIGSIMVIGFFVCGVLAIFLSDDRTTGAVIGIIFIVVSLFLSIIYCLECLKISRADRGWKIIINSEQLIWQAPQNLEGSLKEKSFSLSLEEIEKIQMVAVSDQRSDTGSRHCLIIMKDNTEIELNPQSFIPLHQFIRALNELGIINEVIYEKT